MKIYLTVISEGLLSLLTLWYEKIGEPLPMNDGVPFDKSGFTICMEFTPNLCPPI